MTVTMEEVARQAGVSRKTVSRVINREPSVKPMTRERVWQAVESLHYRPDPSARSLRGAHSYVVGLAYDNPNTYYVVAMQEGALSACRELGFGLLIHPRSMDGQHPAQDLVELVQHSRLAGMVLLPPMADDTRLLQFLEDAGVRFVRVLSASSDPGGRWPCVYVNDCDAAHGITEHLIHLGHTRIGFLWGNDIFGSSSERFKGYAAALKEYGVPLARQLVVKGNYSFEDGFRGARKLLALKQRPTAIFGSNDEIAAGVLAAARAAEVSVPYDLSIAGFEDSPFSRQSWPALTTARQDTHAIARYAARLLISTLREVDSSEVLHNRCFTPELVVRSSTAMPRSRSHAGV